MPTDTVKSLLVDDLEENLLALEAMLKREGLELLKAHNGPQALELLLVHDVALAIVDVQMPGMDGFELAELMRGTERTRRIPIIFVTAGAGDMQRRFRGYEIGAVDFLFKPIEPRILQSKAEVFFELYRQRQDIARQRDQLHVAAEQNARLLEETRRAAEALRELNATLERKVAGRTAGLEQRARQLQKLTLELSQAEDRERKRMADILHDDLQQQLVAAKFHLSLLKKPTEHDPHQRAVVAQVDQMLNDAVETSRSLAHDLSPAVLHGGDLVQTFEWLARQMQTRHGLTVRVDSTGEVRLQSDALKAFLYKAGQELLFNVVKHAQVGEAVVRLRLLGPYVGLSVADCGCGFDAQGLKQATGFGLFSIRERVELLGGHMTIKSSKGQGSTFRVIAPVQASAEAAARAKCRDVRTRLKSPARGERAAATKDQRLRVLLADDHEVVRQGLKAILNEATGVQVIGEAANGREAVDMAGRLGPDVVIMDVSMPLLGGEQATRQIKALLPGTRIIALSVYDEPETVARMHRAGAEDYVLKTAPSEELLSSIRGKKSDS